MKDVEIEIQVRISNKTKLQIFLEKNAKPKGKKYQKDEYYTPAHRNFIEQRPIAEWLRLRQSGSDSITYKNWYYDKNNESQYCDEYETAVNDIEQLRKIFTALDLKPVVTVEKTRTAWKYKDYEIALDHVTDLGDFIEIEYKGKGSGDPKKVTNDMIAFLKEVDCGKIERNFVGYPFMLLYPDEVKFKVV